MADSNPFTTLEEGLVRWITSRPGWSDLGAELVLSKDGRTESSDIEDGEVSGDASYPCLVTERSTMDFADVNTGGRAQVGNVAPRLRLLLSCRGLARDVLEGWACVEPLIAHVLDALHSRGAVNTGLGGVAQAFEMTEPVLATGPEAEPIQRLFVWETTLTIYGQCRDIGS